MDNAFYIVVPEFLLFLYVVKICFFSSLCFFRLMLLYVSFLIRSIWFDDVRPPSCFMQYFYLILDRDSLFLFWCLCVFFLFAISFFLFDDINKFHIWGYIFIHAYVIKSDGICWVLAKPQYETAPHESNTHTYRNYFSKYTHCSMFRRSISHFLRYVIIFYCQTFHSHSIYGSIRFFVACMWVGVCDYHYC